MSGSRASRSSSNSLQLRGSTFFYFARCAPPAARRQPAASQPAVSQQSAGDQSPARQWHRALRVASNLGPMHTDNSSARYAMLTPALPPPPHWTSLRLNLKSTWLIIRFLKYSRWVEREGAGYAYVELIYVGKNQPTEPTKPSWLE